MLLLLLTLLLPAPAWSDELPVAEPRFDKLVTWADPAYPETVWRYLQDTDATSESRWPGIPPRDQTRLLALASEKGPVRRDEVLGRYREILSFCGMRPKKEDCDPKPLSEVGDEELRSIEIWRTRHAANFIRKSRDAVRARTDSAAPESAPQSPQLLGQAEKMMFSNPREKALSDAWNRFFLDDFQSNAVGRGILDHLKGGLPPMKLVPLQANALADFNPATVFIRVNSLVLAQEIRFHEPGLKADDPQALGEYLLTHADVAGEVFKAYRDVEAHEATHAAQSEAFRDDLLHEKDKADFLEAEHHAFTVQHRFTLAALEGDSRHLASMSPISRVSRDSLTFCLVDYERCMGAIGPAYTHAHELSAKLSKADPAKSALILERMKGFYEDFAKSTRQDWTEKNSRGLLLLAERLPSVSPREAVYDLVSLERLLPKLVHGGELGPRFERALDQALPAYEQALRSEGDAAKLRELEAIRRHFGRTTGTRAP